MLTLHYLQLFLLIFIHSISGMEIKAVKDDNNSEERNMEYFGDYEQDSSSIYDDKEDSKDMDNSQSTESRYEETRDTKTCRGSKGDRYEIGTGSLIFRKQKCIQRMCVEKKNKAKWEYKILDECIYVAPVAPKPKVPIDCSLSTWGIWSMCSESCGKGVRSRQRNVLREAVHGGQECQVERSQEQQCAQEECPLSPIDCWMSSWTTWRACSVSCDVGVQSRYRFVLQEAMHGGKKCEVERIQEQMCIKQKCPLLPIYCTLSSWSDWSRCSESCGGGFRSRYRFLLQEAMHGGKECEVERSEEQQCSNEECPLAPIDCTISSWSDWSMCSVSCGEGVQSRHRLVLQEPSHDGKKCPVGRSEEQPCHEEACLLPPVDCSLSSWSDWSVCSMSCGEGVQNRHRLVLQEPSRDGKKCAEGRSEEQPCREEECPLLPIDCSLSSWSDWSMCSESCGGGFRSRYRLLLQEAMHGGKECEVERSEEQQCSKEECPLVPTDCSLSSWTDWSVCSMSCGGGVQSRNRLVLQNVILDGKECEVGRSEEQQCAQEECPLFPVDCTLSAWSDWSVCSESCGGGVQSRYRLVLQEALHGGKKCEVQRSQEQQCAQEKCPLDPPVLLHTDVNYQYYKVPVPAFSKMTSALVLSTCRKNDMKAQCYSVDLVDDNCIAAPSTSIAAVHPEGMSKILCSADRPHNCAVTLNMFWYMKNWNSGYSCGATKAGGFCSYGKDFISTIDLRYFAACVKPV